MLLLLMLLHWNYHEICILYYYLLFVLSLLWKSHYYYYMKMMFWWSMPTHLFQFFDAWSVGCAFFVYRTMRNSILVCIQYFPWYHNFKPFFPFFKLDSSSVWTSICLDLIIFFFFWCKLIEWNCLTEPITNPIIKFSRKKLFFFQLLMKGFYRKVIISSLIM